MNFYLLSAVLLLVPLVSADLRPKVVAKLMHKDDYFIGEAVNMSRIEYKYFNLHWLRFVLQNSTYKYSNYLLVSGNSQMPLKELEFAVEMFEEESMKGMNCSQKSEEHLRGIIGHCSGPIAIRSLTNEESLQIRHYKWAQEKSQEAFRVVHEHSHIQTESVGQTDFQIFVTKEARGDGKEVYTRSDVNGFNVRLMWLRNTKTDTPLVIVGHPSSRVNCRHVKSPDISVKTCTGDVSARRVD